MSASAPSLQRETGCLRTFSALRNPGFRAYCVALVFFFAGIQMQMLAQGWLVYALTGSSFMLGIVTSMWSVAIFLFSLFGGVIADRVEKRDLLVWTQVGITLTGAAVALLVVTGTVQVWHLVVASFAQGTILAFHFPARQSLIPELVGDERTMNANALTNAAFSIAGIVMPAIAGYLVTLIQVGGVLALVVLAFGLTIAGYQLLPRTGTTNDAPRPVVQELTGGLDYAWREKNILSLLILSLIPVLFVWPFQTLLPAFTVTVLGVGAGTLGLLMSAYGVGSFVGAIVVASSGDFRRKGLATLVLGIGSGASLGLFALSQGLPLALTALFLMGLFGIPYLAVNTTMLQVMVPPAVRARVISLTMMTLGLMPLGALPLSALADAAGVSVAFMTAALLLLGATGAIFLLRRSLLSL
ncbi:MAG: MFS transporter [Chloroflexi bacterium]|nr:MFS transporter [Chloroflexota bacterium]